jgi:hypothetical protein
MSRVDMPVVVLIGLLGSQKEHVRSKLKDIADLRFLETDKCKPSQLPKGDLFVCWNRYARHGHSEAAQQAAPIGGYTGHHGGLKEMITLISENLERRFPKKFIPVPVAVETPHVNGSCNTTEEPDMDEVRDILKLIADQHAECHLEINERLLELTAQLKRMNKPRFITVLGVNNNPAVHIQSDQISTVKAHVEGGVKSCLIVMRNGERVLTPLTPAEVSKLLEQL